MSYGSKEVKAKYVIGICVGWFFVSILLDHFVFRKWAPWYTRIFALEDVKYIIYPFDGSLTQLSITTFLLFPFLVTAITLIVLAIKKDMTITDIFKSLSDLVWGLIVIVIAVVVGEVIYKLISGVEYNFIKVIKNFCEGYEIKGTIYLFDINLKGITIGFGALVGLAVGFYAYYNKGFLKILMDKAGLDLS